MRVTMIFLILCFGVMSSSWAKSGSECAVSNEIEASRIFELVDELASPKYEGRLTGTSGCQKAADFACDLLISAGINPPKGGYMQTWPVSFCRISDAALELAFTDAAQKTTTIQGAFFDSFYPLGISAQGDIKAEVVFVGYGITASEYNVDDYRDIDVNGKIVLAVYGAPTAEEGETWRPYVKSDYKADNARKHGAIGLLLIFRPLSIHVGTPVEALPVGVISEELADKILENKGVTTKTLRTLLNLRRNVSFGTGVTAHLNIASEKVQGQGINVLGLIHGTHENLKNEAVVVCAHLDHEGTWPTWVPGADDNASGVAAVLAMAEGFAKADCGAKRSILFALVSGEEMGLLGSDYLVNHLPEGIDTVHFAVNLDVVGVGNGMYIMGLKKNPKIDQLIRQIHSELGLSSEIDGSQEIDTTSADHGPFVKKGYPALTIVSSGRCESFHHTEKDTIYWITPKITEDIARLSAKLVVHLANQ